MTCCHPFKWQYICFMSIQSSSLYVSSLQNVSNETPIIQVMRNRGISSIICVKLKCVGQALVNYDS